MSFSFHYGKNNECRAGNKGSWFVSRSVVLFMGSLEGRYLQILYAFSSNLLGPVGNQPLQILGLDIC